MKKILFSIISFLFLAVWSCFADDLWYKINSYDVDAYIQKDWKVYIVENIGIHYYEESHWFIREIPFLYERDEKTLLKTPISNISVEWVEYQKSEQWNFLVLKIGSKKETVIWDKNYKISYQVEWAIRSFTWLQELYYNIIGTDWDTSIDNVNFKIYLPNENMIGEEDYYAKIWAFWSTDEIKVIKVWTIIKNTESLHLWAHEWVTVSIKFAENTFFTEEILVKKTVWRKIVNFINTEIRVYIAAYGLYWLFLVWLIFICAFIYKYSIKQENFYLKHKKKEWENVKDVIYYDPPKWYYPWEVAIIKDLKSTTTVFATMLYYWIGKWLVKLEVVNWRPYFRKVPDVDMDSYQFQVYNDTRYYTKPEKEFWNFCFWRHATYSPSDVLTAEEANHLKWIADSIYMNIMGKFCPWVSDSCLRKNIITWMDISWPASFSIWLVFVLFVCLILFSEWLWIYSFFPMFIFLIFMFFVSASRTITIYKISHHLIEEAKEVMAHVWWFRKYLLAVEDEKLNLAIKDDPKYFDKMLPYAIALWIWDEWIKKGFSFSQFSEVEEHRSYYAGCDVNQMTTSLGKSIMIWRLVESVSNETRHYNSDSWWWRSSSSSRSRSSSSSSHGFSWWHSWSSWWGILWWGWKRW